MDSSQVADILELEQVLSTYAVGMTRIDMDMVASAFTPDGTYSAFGDTYRIEEFSELAKAAPKGLYAVGRPAIDLDGDAATGVQPLCFVIQTDHSMRIGYYTDTYARTAEGWRIATRSMTFMRRSGAHDSGRPHDPLRPKPGEKAVG